MKNYLVFKKKFNEPPNMAKTTNTTNKKLDCKLCKLVSSDDSGKRKTLNFTIAPVKLSSSENHFQIISNDHGLTYAGMDEKQGREFMKIVIAILRCFDTKEYTTSYDRGHAQNTPHFTYNVALKDKNGVRTIGSRPPWADMTYDEREEYIHKMMNI